jgi:hypothetical protein
VSGKSAVATALVTIYAGACAVALWSLADAIWITALVSLATLWFIFPPMAVRVAIGAVTSVVAVGLGITLPGIGDAIDAVAALIALVLFFGKMRRFLVRIPLGAACFGLYYILWIAAQKLPPAYSLVGTHHSSWFDIAAMLIAAIGGVLYLLIIAGVCKLFSVPPATAIIYTVGYPCYLILFFITFFVPDAGDSLSDS